MNMLKVYINIITRSHIVREAKLYPWAV